MDSIEAVSDPELYSDTRPRFFDNFTKSWTLLDSGSCVSCVPRGPDDKIDTSLNLKAVNGQSIPTFGTKLLKIRIGRKEYEIEAVKTDIPQTILGWNFFKKYRLGFEWKDEDLYLTDKKAQTKSLLKFIKIDSSIKRVESMDLYEEPLIQNDSPETIFFQTQCMQHLNTNQEVGAMSIHPDQIGPIADNIPLSAEVDPDANECYNSNIKALEKVKKPYVDLIKKFPKILAANFKKEPAKDIYHRIETTGAPFKSKVRPLLASSEKSEKGRKIWEEMEKLGVIEKVDQSTVLQYTSPLHMVKKPSGDGWRVCADFRLLNEQTTSDNYPLPLLRSFQNKIKGAKVFSTIDLHSAFHHLPIHPNDVYKTCVLSPWGGAYVYKRLAFGLSNGPSSWQKYIDNVLSGIPNTFCYLDDILVCSANVEEHMSTLSKIFKRLEDNELTLSVAKCTFAEETVDYLGYEVNGKGIRPLKRKTEAINRIPPPTTQKQLLQFLGALNYFRSSLSGLKIDGIYHNAANLLQPLYSAATVPIAPGKFTEVWSSSPCLQQSFQHAKTLLINAAQLSHPDPNLPLALMTDASQHSVGAVLLQRETTGKWTPLGYMSRHLSVDKTRWSTCRKELLAAQAGLRYFISEIYGRHCTIFSDHAPLVLAFKNPMGFQLHDPVAQRALVEIGQFTKDVRHIAGLKNTGSDFLSRIPQEIMGSEYVDKTKPHNQIAALEGYKLISMSPEVIRKAQETCKETQSIRDGKHPTSVIFEDVDFGECKILCEMSNSKPRPFLPKELRSFVMKNMHYAHAGIKETNRLIATHYYWSEMRAEITRFVQTCHGCQSVKTSKITPPHYGFFEVPDQRFTHCHLDVVGPLPVSEGYKYILTIIDRTTRHLTALPLRDTSAKTCSQQFLLHYVALYGVPSACTSDQGSNFVSKIFQEMQQNLGIDIKHTPIYWPQGNGLIERNHQSLKNSIKAQLVEMGEIYKENWIKYLPWALLGRRTAFNKDLNTSSSELTLGTHIQVPGCILQEVNSEEPNINDVLKKLQFKNNRVAIPTSSNKQEETESPPSSISHVYAKQHDTRGLQPRYRGPFRVLARPNRSTLEIKVGLTKAGENRSELRAWADCKPAYLREDATEAERPRRGRPPKPFSGPEAQIDPFASNSQPLQNQNKVAISEPFTSPNLDSDPPFHGFKTAAIDFSKPPPPFKVAGNLNTTTTSAERAWTASPQELDVINRSIIGS